MGHIGVRRIEIVFYFPYLIYNIKLNMNSIPENQVLYGVFDVSENTVLSVVPDADTANLEREVQIIHHYNSDVKCLRRQIEAVQMLDPESSDDESDEESDESSVEDLEGDIDRVTKQVLKITELENLQMQLEDKRLMLSKVKGNLKIVKIEVQ